MTNPELVHALAEWFREAENVQSLLRIGSQLVRRTAPRLASWWTSQASRRRARRAPGTGGGRICAMTGRREGLLAQIETGVLDDRVPLASLLQKCIVLGGRAGSEKMRDWARRELNGYPSDLESLPDYRRVSASLYATVTNDAGYNSMEQELHRSDFPSRFHDWDPNELPLRQGIGELEAFAESGEQTHRFTSTRAQLLIGAMNRSSSAPNSHVAALYWELPNAAIRGVLVGVRTALAELVAELEVLTPAGQEVPDKAAADQAVQLVVTGERPTINVTTQHAAAGGTNLSTIQAGPLTVASGSGTAIGSQTASGQNSTVVGAQTAHGDHATVTGHDSGTTPDALGHEREGWWTRLRKRGVLVAFFTITGGIAGIVAAIAAVLTLVDWTPW